MSRKILIANRGALRLVRAVRDLGIAGIAVFADDDAQAPHVRHADAAAAVRSSARDATCRTANSSSERAGCTVARARSGV